MLKQVFVLLFLIAAVAESVYFVVVTDDNSPFTFVVELNNRNQIQHARDLINGKTENKPHISGRIIKRTAKYNPNYSYHFDPTTVELFNEKYKYCDGNFFYVEDHIDEVGNEILPKNYFCPSSSRFVKEFKPRKLHFQNSFKAGRRYSSAEKQDSCY